MQGLAAVRSSIVVSGLFIVIIGCTDTAERGKEGTIEKGGQLLLADAKIGHCFNSKVGEVADVAAVPCAEPHDFEVFAVFDHPAGKDDPFPGDAEIEEFGQERCLEEFESYVGMAFDASPLDARPIAPTKDSWENDDDRSMLCVLQDAEDKKLAGSQKAG